jgi:hypothetical protein
MVNPEEIPSPVFATQVFFHQSGVNRFGGRKSMKLPCKELIEVIGERRICSAGGRVIEGSQ